MKTFASCLKESRICAQDLRVQSFRPGVDMFSNFSKQKVEQINDILNDLIKS